MTTMTTELLEGSKQRPSLTIHVASSSSFVPLHLLWDPKPYVVVPDGVTEEVFSFRELIGLKDGSFISCNDDYHCTLKRWSVLPTKKDSSNNNNNNNDNDNNDGDSFGVIGVYKGGHQLAVVRS